MKRQALILICILTAAGCGRWTDVDSDAFAPGGATQEQFMLDSAACNSKAENTRSYELHGIVADNVDKHAIFNRAYAACMRTKGYHERASLTDFLESYDL